nr:MAG TPA: hypothetical protein [Caudoviricetes sp.]DAX43582.1 MAG TPA: hypothetical protein [Caudoviricetes sp.]
MYLHRDISNYLFNFYWSMRLCWKLLLSQWECS